MKIWELHAMNLRGAIRTTPDDRADVAGLVFSEKAYLLAVRDFRPAELVNLVEREGPHEAARRLVAHFSSEEVLNACGGRGLVAEPERLGPDGRRGDREDQQRGDDHEDPDHGC